MSSLAEEKKLKEELYQKTWRGEYFGKEGAIKLGKTVFRQTYSIDNPNPLMGLASTYYSAAAHAWSRFHKGPFWLITAIWCLIQAFRLSSRFERLVGTKNMTADQLDVYASILFQTRIFKKRALDCVYSALGKEGLSPSTRVLLLIKGGEIHNALHDRQAASMFYREAGKIWKETPPTTQVRYCRSVARHNELMGNKLMKEKWLRTARDIAKEHKLNDQLVKAG